MELGGYPPRNHLDIYKVAFHCPDDWMVVLHLTKVSRKKMKQCSLIILMTFWHPCQNDLKLKITQFYMYSRFPFTTHYLNIHWILLGMLTLILAGISYIILLTSLQRAFKNFGKLLSQHVTRG
jgi:hypothetical protein